MGLRTNSDTDDPYGSKNCIAVGGTDSDPYGSKNTAGLPTCLPDGKQETCASYQ